MIKGKTIHVRNHVLTLIEEGRLKEGAKLPGARCMAKKLGVSFVKVQQAIETLASDGVIEVRDRSGAFVQAGWRKRILHENITIFRDKKHFPWLKGLVKIMEKKIPELRFTYAFPKGILELKPTLHVQGHSNEYMDMSGILYDCYPDRSVFFEEPFKAFMVGGRLVGIPFSFSPRVVFYNHKVLSKAGCREPEAGWRWEDFMEILRKLRKRLPMDRIINWHIMPYYWLNFVMRSGGRIFKENKTGVRVAVDSPQVRKGLELFSEVGKELEFTDCGPEYDRVFTDGKAAMLIAGRQLTNILNMRKFESWKTIPLPVIPGGEDVTSQSTDVLCVRKSCTNLAIAREYVRIMLSEEVQDYIGERKYSIPIRKSSAFKSIDLTDPRDSVFAVEMGKLGNEINPYSPVVLDFMLRGINCLLESRGEIDSGLSRLAVAAETYLNVIERSDAKGATGEVLAIA